MSADGRCPLARGSGKSMAVMPSIQCFRFVHVTLLLMLIKCGYDNIVPEESHLKVTDGLKS